MFSVKIVVLRHLGEGEGYSLYRYILSSESKENGCGLENAGKK